MTSNSNPALQCFCVEGESACPHPEELSCAYYHIEFGLKKARELQTKGWEKGGKGWPVNTPR
jgi:hypothetical protein